MTDVFSETNTAVPDTDAKPAVEYVPMADSFAQEEPKKKYASDSDGLKEAAADLEEARAAGTVKQAESEPLERHYQFLTGDRAGEAIPENQTISAERAARDVAMMREYEAAQQQPPQSDIAAAIDDVRNQYSANPQPQAQTAEAQQTPEQPQAQSTEQPQAQPGIDPEVSAALNNPKIRAAISAEVEAAENARQQFAQSARTAAQVTAAALLSQHPEIASLSAAEIPHALAAISKVDPAKAATIQAQLGQVKALYDASQQAEQAQRQIQAQQIQAWVKNEDAKFERDVASKEDPATMKKIGENIFQIAQEAYGITKADFTHAWQTQPILRSSAFQSMMLDAAKFRLAQREVGSKLDRSAPPVQRPGVSQPRSDDGEVSAAMAKFRANPTPKSAADLLTAKRDAARRR